MYSANWSTPPVIEKRPDLMLHVFQNNYVYRPKHEKINSDFNKLCKESTNYLCYIFT